jgi:hypothetical protein
MPTQNKDLHPTHDCLEYILSTPLIEIIPAYGVLKFPDGIRIVNPTEHSIRVLICEEEEEID